MHVQNQIENSAKWKGLLKTGGVSAIVLISLIPVQMYIFTAFPPPETASGFFILFEKNWFLGLLSLDLLYIINNSLLIFVYLGLFAALQKAGFSTMIMAVSIGFIGIAAYFASTVAFEMLSLSKLFAVAENAEIKNQLLAAAQSLLVRYQGTAFNVYYIFNAVTLLMIVKVMFRENIFSKASAIWGLAAGLFMLIPSTFGTIGLIFSILSLIPWIVFSVLIAKRMLFLANQ